MKTVTHNFYCMKGVTMELKRYGSEQERISWKKPAQVEHFMSLLMKQDVKCTAFLQCCNKKDGNPYWTCFLSS